MAGYIYIEHNFIKKRVINFLCYGVFLLLSVAFQFTEMTPFCANTQNTRLLDNSKYSYCPVVPIFIYSFIRAVHRKCTNPNPILLRNDFGFDYIQPNSDQITELALSILILFQS